MIKVRKSIFETNSSTTHSYTIHVGNYTDVRCYDEYEHEDIDLDDSDICEILYALPIEYLENIIKQRKENEANTTGTI